jgi:hypothetical protein
MASGGLTIHAISNGCLPDCNRYRGCAKLHALGVRSPNSGCNLFVGREAQRTGHHRPTNGASSPNKRGDLRVGRFECVCPKACICCHCNDQAIVYLPDGNVHKDDGVSMMKNSIAVWVLLSCTMVGWGQQPRHDTSQLAALKKALLDHSYRCWDGIPMQQIDGNCVAGYTSVEKYIRFHLDFTFEQIVYKDAPFMLAPPLPDEIKTCADRRDGYELSRRTGIWHLQQDTVHLSFLQESIFEYDVLAACYWFKDGTSIFHCDHLALRSCQLHAVETYCLRDERLCGTGNTIDCYR